MAVVSDFYRLAREKKEVSLADAAEALGEDPKVLEGWADVLDDHGLLRLVYPINPFKKVYVEYVKQAPGLEKKLSEAQRVIESKPRRVAGAKHGW